MIGSMFIKHKFKFMKVIKGKSMACRIEDAIDGKYVLAENIKDGSLQNIFRARPYLSDPYDSYFCDEAREDPFSHSEDCKICKPYDEYWNGFDLGFLCGSINKIIVVDIDPRNIRGFKTIDDFIEKIRVKHGELPPTWTVDTPSGGIHLYYKYPYRFNSNKGAHIPGVDFLGDNSWSKFPPSVKDDGRKYQWTTPPILANLAPLPDWIAAIAHLKPKRPNVNIRTTNFIATTDDESQARNLLDKVSIEQVSHRVWVDIGYILCGKLNLERVFVDWCMSDSRKEKLVKSAQLSNFRSGNANSLGALVKLLKDEGYY